MTTVRFTRTNRRGIAAPAAGGSMASSSWTDTARRPRTRIACRIFGSARTVQGCRSCRRMIDPGRSPRSTFRTIAPTRACGTSSRASTFQNTSTSPSLSEMSSVARECSAYGVRKSRGFQPTWDVDLVLRPHQLEPDEPVRQARQVRVRPRVVADAAEPRLRVGGPRPVREPVADVEEGRVRAVPLQDPEQLRRVRARPVVERERDRVTVTAAARDDLPPRRGSGGTHGVAPTRAESWVARARASAAPAPPSPPG